MATLISSLVTQARRPLLEATAKFWSDAELLDLAKHGINDLWGAILDLHQEHFLTIDETNVSLAADATSLSGVPADVFRVHLIEPRDLTSSGAARNLVFEPKDYNHADFAGARSMSAQGVEGQTVFYALISAGAPVGAPVIKTAPKLNTSVLLRLAYVPTFGALTASDNNPIPGEGDQAVIAWIVAYARAKEREDRSPDPEWLAIYGTEKKNLLTRLTPRQTQEPDTVEDVHEPFLLTRGLLRRTPRGRVATAAAYAHLGLTLPMGTAPAETANLFDE